jgi:outer membrane protein TolC
VVLAGCSSAHYRKSADREAARLIQEKTPAVRNMDTNFTIEVRAPVDLSALPRAAAPPEFLGDEGTAERDCHQLDLLTALDLAVRQSREYQARKELVFLNALDLSLARQRHTPLFSGTAGSFAQGSTPQPVFGTDPITGQPTVVARSDSTLIRTSGRLGASWLLASGARLTTAFTTDFLRYLAGNRDIVGSELSGSIVVPLLRGGGYAVTLENLTSAERSLLYTLREFAQYRKDFTVDTAASYYGVLQNRDAARNAWTDLQRSRQNVEREQAFAAEGLRPLASLDQFRQASLTSETRWIEAVRNYRDSLDRFKLTLGVPLDTRLVLDDRELENLRIQDPTIPPALALDVAQSLRLDLQNGRDRVEDATRRIKVARNGLRPQLDIRGGANIAGNSSQGFRLPDPGNYQWNGGIDLDLPFNRKSERNAYRGAIIAQARAEREFSLQVDQVRLQIASDWRALDQARRNHANGELAVQLGERRVEEQGLRMELGRGVTRDLLDAQADLIAARNNRTAAIVAHSIARLRYWRDMGLLHIRNDGTWDEGTTLQGYPPTGATNNLPSSPNSQPPTVPQPPTEGRVTSRGAAPNLQTPTVSPQP